MLSTNFLSGGGSKGDGRNLFVMADSEPGFLSDSNDGTIHVPGSSNEVTSDYIPVSSGGTFTIQVWVTAYDVGYTYYLIDYMWFSGTSPDTHIGEKNRVIGGELGFNHVIVRTVPVPETAKYIRVSTRLYSDGKIKVERGSIATDWSPAPEDVATHTDVEQAVTGENLFIRNTNIVVYNGSIKVDESINGFVITKIGSDTSSGRRYIRICYDASTERNTDYCTIYGEIYANQNIDINFDLMDGTMSNTIHLTNNPQRFIEPIKKGSSLSGGKPFVDISFPVAPPEETNIYIKNFKIEPGFNKNSFYTPSPTDQLFHALDPIPEAHRNIFRGKNLGTVFTDTQKAAIADGSFHDLWLGDYWVINDHTWRIVDINYWMNKGDRACTTPHIVVMPDARLYIAKMNNDSTTDNGYQGSLMRTEGLTQAKEIINTDFGEDYVLNHRVLLANAAVSGHASSGDWYDSTVELPNEIMMYGCPVFSAMNVGTNIPYLQTTESTQLALFRLVPRFINASKQWFWLRDVVSATAFAGTSGSGMPAWNSASIEAAVRPVFGITGGAVAADEAGDDLEVTGLSKGGEPL